MPVIENGDKELENRAKERFRRDPKATCNAARRGSEYDTIAVLDALETKEVPPRLRDICYGAIFDTIPYLNQRCYHENSGIRSWCVMVACINAVRHLEENFFMPRKKLKERWMSALPHLSAWIVFTLEIAVNKDPSKYQSALLEPAYNAIRLIYDYAHEYPSCWVPLRTESTLKTVARTWLRQAPSKATMVASYILFMIFLCDKNILKVTNYAEKRQIVLEVASELSLSAEDVVELALTRLGFEKETLVGHLDALLVLVMMSPQTKQTENRVLQRAFVAQGGVAAVLKTMRRVFRDMNFDFRFPNNCRITSMDAARIQRGLQVTFKMLHCIPSWITYKQALGNGLLRILAFSSTPAVINMLDCETKQGVQTLIEHSLVDFMMVRQVCVSIRKAIQKFKFMAPSLTSDGYMPPQFKGSSAYDAWKTLFSCIRHHSESLRIYRHERKIEMVVCENESCSRRGSRSTFRKCAGCEVSYFCSRACQATAWRVHGHKDICQRIREQQDRSGLSIQDLDYMARDARENIRMAYYETKRKTKEDYGGRALEVRYSARGTTGFIDFFDWEYVKRDENPFVYRLGCGDKSDTRITVVPPQPQAPDPNLGTRPHSSDEDEVELTVKMEYALGFESHVVYFSALFRQALLEGRLCACCRFHDDLVDHHRLCLVHTKGQEE